MTWIDPEVRDAPVPEIEVLIKEARRRQRKRQVRAAGALLALVGVGCGAGFGFFGNGGGGRRAPNGGGDRGAAGASSSVASLSSARVIASASFEPAGYALGVRHGEISVAPEGGWPGRNCLLLSPRTLRVVTANRRCTAPSDLPRGVVVDDYAKGDQVRVRSRNPATGKTKLSAPLMTLQNWFWAHSGAIEGDGAFWIYELGPYRHRSSLIEVSATTGALLHRFYVPAGEEPFMKIDADGFWITQSGYGGTSCARSCTLWHVAPGGDRLVPERALGVRTQWLTVSGHSIYADVLAAAGDRGFTQTIWRLEGDRARVVYRTPARLLPSTDFGMGTGYVVTGNAHRGFFTLTQLGSGSTLAGVGGCASTAPVRLIRIDPATGTQSYVATVPLADDGHAFDCHLYSDQAVLDDGAFFVLAGEINNFPEYTQVVRLPT
ncbi:MAG TPA: hypothetical protein VHU61_07825 [Solirubrobacteraceae bacterium]|nr:hypothetical protein [Solirubrobacteraceae bacterium]